MSERRARWLGLLVVTGVLVAPVPPAGADQITSTDLRDLARRAPDDPRALSQLRRVDRVDGRPVDLGRALDAPDPVARDRARSLAVGLGERLPAPPDAGTTREQAEEILAERRFRPRGAPRPLKGVLDRLGGWLRPVGEPIGRFLADLSANRAALVVVAASVVALTALASLRAARRRMAGATRVEARRRWRRADPDQLEREADGAERRGELERAFRLRFQAGLLRLEDAGVLAFRPSLTTGELVRLVPSGTLPSLTTALEEIVYGGRPAQPQDVDASHHAWPQVLEEAKG